MQIMSIRILHRDQKRREGVSVGRPSDRARDEIMSTERSDKKAQKGAEPAMGL